MLCAQEYEEPSGALEQAIEADFGALDGLVSRFNAAAGAVQGRSGRGLGLGVGSEVPRSVSRSGQVARRWHMAMFGWIHRLPHHLVTELP